MEQYRVVFDEVIDRTSTVKSFRFLPEKEVSFKAGQFLQIVFDKENPKNLELNKYLSFSNRPGEKYIEVTKRLSDSEFSKRLSALKKGDELFVNASMGRCVFDGEYKKIGFLIGGIGITPVVSIVDHIIFNKMDTDVHLLYSNRFEHDIAFREKFDSYALSNDNFKVDYTLTECSPQDDVCHAGLIDAGLIEKCMPDWQERVLYIFGTPGMVKAMKSLCDQMNGCPQKILNENFMGY